MEKVNQMKRRILALKLLPDVAAQGDWLIFPPTKPAYGGKIKY